MDDDSGDMFSSLFVCEDYITKQFDFNGINLSLLCSNAAMTDHDLTGQIVWPAAKVLSWFIATHQDTFRDKVVLELGAGTGLAGFVAAKISGRTIVTDGNEVVMRLIERNVELLSSPQVDVVGRQLMWGEKNEVASLSGHTADIPDIIIGADVILWPRFVRPLLLTVRWLLSLKPSSARCIISYVNRAESTTDLFFSSALTLGLHVKIVDVNTFLPVPSDPSAGEEEASKERRRDESVVIPSPDMAVFEISLPAVIVLENGSRKIAVESDQSLFHDLPEEDPAWSNATETLNSPC